MATYRKTLKSVLRTLVARKVVIDEAVVAETPTIDIDPTAGTVTVTSTSAKLCYDHIVGELLKVARFK